MPPKTKSAAGSSGQTLVIVESPAKAKTIGGYLGEDYIVESSIGHIRDLPRNASDVPESHKKEKWARLGVDVDNGFKPLYVVSPDKKSHVANLKRLAKAADQVFLATDEDREGEAIAWHLLEALGLDPHDPRVHRMVFHEITRAAILEAVSNPREIDDDLVAAQETRRILDRLYGYEVSPVLWKKVMPKLSAGRVQSVATRVIVQRERARMAFHAASYWDIDASLAGTSDPTSFVATLVSVDGRRLATGKDFDAETGHLRTDAVQLGEAEANGLASRLSSSDFVVKALDSKPYRRSPAAPFMTSTLQQEAGRKLRMTAQQAMRTAQRLYENGYITYMRTDSTTLSETALAAARTQVRELYGAEYLPTAPRVYTKKVKNAQEAHEAIRPSGESFRTPGEIAGQVSADELRLYELIWQRTIASQMTDAAGTSSRITVSATSSAGEEAEFAATGTVITFPGFLRVYVEGSDDEESGESEGRLPNVAAGEALTVGGLTPTGHTTQPPARFTEASLVKALEEMGVGRPSTYASIIATIQDRGYVWKKGSALVPALLAFAVTRLLEEHFPQLVDFNFTASLEDDLDTIANGDAEMVAWLTAFYFGSDVSPGLKRMVSEDLEAIDAKEVSSIRLGLDDTGAEIVARVGRYGPYVERMTPSGEAERANVPEDLAPDELTVARALELLAQPSGDRDLGLHPESGLAVIAKSGRYGPYVTIVPPEDSKSKEKPPTASLFKDMSLDTITLEQALSLLTLPRVVGADPTDGVEITAQNGRYGPYIKKGTDSRTLPSEDLLLTIGLDEALTIFAQPKPRGRGRGAAAEPLKTLGPDPASGGEVTVRDGRFGPYVTDGETNASLRKEDAVETITIDRAAELLADRRARGPVTKKKAAPKKAAAKKATATKAPAKKAPRKATAKA